MAKVAIVYWSGSGNTEAMAQAVEEGAKAAGAETTLSFVSDTTASDVAAFDHIVLGCPAMGNEELEEYEFEPFFAELLPQLKGKLSAFSAPTLGIRATGSKPGNSVLPMKASNSLLNRSKLTAIRTTMHWQLAKLLAKPLLKRNDYIKKGVPRSALFL